MLVGSLVTGRAVSRFATGSQMLFSATKRSVKLSFLTADGSKKEVSAKEGQTLLEVAQANDINIEGACGGNMACSTCHLIFEPQQYQQLAEPCDEELDVLDLAWGLTDTYKEVLIAAWVPNYRLQGPRRSDT